LLWRGVGSERSELPGKFALCEDVSFYQRLASDSLAFTFFYESCDQHFAHAKEEVVANLPVTHRIPRG
jgi:hypothetical protein